MFSQDSLKIILILTNLKNTRTINIKLYLRNQNIVPKELSAVIYINEANDVSYFLNNAKSQSECLDKVSFS